MATREQAQAAKHASAMASATALQAAASANYGALSIANPKTRFQSKENMAFQELQADENKNNKAGPGGTSETQSDFLSRFFGRLPFFAAEAAKSGDTAQAAFFQSLED
jgi:hypothetical protein